jgi:hypothetical protein
MIKNPGALKNFEDDFMRKGGSLSLSQSWGLLDSMWNEAVTLGHFPPKEPLEGIEVDLRIARVLHSCLKKSSPG